MIKIGDEVVCRYFNIPEGIFYGEEWEAKVVDIVQPGMYPEKDEHYLVVKKPTERFYSGVAVWVERKEILRKIK